MILKRYLFYNKCLFYIFMFHYVIIMRRIHNIIDNCFKQLNHNIHAIKYTSIRLYCSIEPVKKYRSNSPSHLNVKAFGIFHQKSGDKNKKISFRCQSTGQIYRWNEVLFGSTFNEIVQLNSGNIDLSQYSVNYFITIIYCRLHIITSCINLYLFSL